MSPLRGTATAVCLGLSLLVAGCGSADDSSQQPSGTSATPTATPSVALKPLADRCSSVTDESTTTPRAVPAGDQQLYAVNAGSGRLGVVLVHGSGSRGMCNWAKEIGWLARAGFQVVAYDQSCVGESTCPSEPRHVEDLLKVVGDLRQRGATQVTVVGASAGGSLPLVAAARPNSGISAVVSLSTAGLAQPIGSADAPDANPSSVTASLRVPVLYVLARDDTASSVAEVTSFQADTKGSQLALLPAGSGHAQEVLYAKDGQQPSAFRQTFLAFLGAPAR